MYQLSHSNVYLINAIVYDTWFNFAKSTSISVQVVEVQLRDTSGSTNIGRSAKYKSKTPQKEN
jgi:hypothetical protein